MAGPLPVKGTEISSAPCSVQKAAGLLRRFLASEAGAEAGIAKGYIEAVAQSLEEMLARSRENGTEGLRAVATSGRSSKFFNLEQMQKVPEVKKKKKKSRKEKEAKKEAKVSKQQQKDQAMIDFEALLGHELDGAEANGFEEKSAVTETTPRPADSIDESQKRKKKRKSLVAGAMDGVKEETLTDPDATKSAKKEKKKKRKSVDGLAGHTPSKAIKVEQSADEDMNDNSSNKKKKKHGETPLNSIVADRGRIGNDSEVQQASSAKKKSKKRASEESPVAKAFHF